MKRKLGLTLGAIVIAGLLVGTFGRGWIAQRAFERALDRNVGIDQSMALGDGLHAYLCGTGSPMPDADRAGPCVGVLAGKQAFVFDAGSGSIRKLMRMGFPMDRMQGAFLTHLHSDHIDGLGELMLQAWIGGARETPLPIHGPAGTDKVVAGFNAAYAIDSGYRIAHHGQKIAHPGGFGGSASMIALADGEDSRVIYTANGVKITVIRVNHAPVAPAFGYRIDYKGRAITLSGDTVYSPAFVTASKGTDLMLHEALNKPMVAALGQKLAQRGHAANAQIMHDIQGYHASPEDAARSAQAAGAQALVLYHLVPPLPSRLIEPLFLGHAPALFSGTLKVGRDGMIVSLPAGSKDVRFSAAF
jgi:ribonuclease Z